MCLLSLASTEHFVSHLQYRIPQKLASRGCRYLHPGRVEDARRGLPTSNATTLVSVSKSHSDCCDLPSPCPWRWRRISELLRASGGNYDRPTRERLLWDISSVITRLRNPCYEFGEICVYKLIASHLRRQMRRNYHTKIHPTYNQDSEA